MGAVGVVLVIGAVGLGPVHIGVPFTLHIKFINLHLFADFQKNSPLEKVAIGERVALVNRVVLYREAFDRHLHSNLRLLSELVHFLTACSQSKAPKPHWSAYTAHSGPEFPVRGVEFPV